MKGIGSLGDVLRIEEKGLPADHPKSTYELIAKSCQAHGSDTALSFFLDTADYQHPVTWTYAELLKCIHQSANFFDSLGAEKDSVIAFVLPNLPETHWVIWGGEAAGIIFAVNPLLESVAIGELLSASGAEIVVTLAPFPGSDLWEKVSASFNKLPDLKHVVTVSLSHHVSGLKGIAARALQLGTNIRRHGMAGLASALPNGAQLHDFNRGLRFQESGKLRSSRQFSADDLSSYFCTGGTTGLPKIAMRRHRNEVANAWSASQFLGDGVGPGKSIFCGLPLFHVNGVLVTGLVPFSQGAHVVLGPPQGYRAPGLVPNFWKVVEHFKINFFSGVPTLYASLLNVPSEGCDLTSLEYGLCGAAPLPQETCRRFEDLTGLKILEGYGLTEGTCVSSVNPPIGERQLGSIGIRIPLQKMKTVVLNDSGDYSRDAAPGEVGVLAISGPNVFAGYKTESQNAGIWLDCGDGERWLNSGDLGRSDAAGYFWLTGRKKELIIRGGHNIDPATIEEPLHRHPAVQVAAAVGRPDAHAGELPIAYVQLKAGMSCSEAELVEFLKREISERAALPKAVHILDKMPLTAVGKIFKPELKKKEITSALSEALTNAGLSGFAIEVVDSKELGICAEFVFENEELIAPAYSVLGKFSVPFSLSAAPVFRG